MKGFSMFSGCGGFDLALERMGIEIIGHSEIDKHADAVYSHHFTNRNYGDATRLIPESLPDFDLLTGGFPCQSFSIAGKRGGFADTRGTLFFEIARIAAEKRPGYLLLENVRGLLSHDGGNTYKTILSALIQLGYDVQAMVLNSKNHGVPQNRERIFIAGCLGGWGGREIFPLGENNEQVDDLQGQNTNTLRARYEGGQAVGSYVVEGKLNAQGNLSRVGTIGDKNQQAMRVYDSEGISQTISSQGGGWGAKTGLYQTNTRIRRLTPIEAERLQGFPDNWTKTGLFDGVEKEISDSQRYKMMGNAVTVNVVEYVLQRMFGSTPHFCQPTQGNQ